MDKERLMIDKEYFEQQWIKHIKNVETNMGMSLDEFHEKLDALITDDYIAKADRYKAFLEDWLQSGKRIVNDKDEELILEDGESFTACFAPDIAGRNELYTFWFISNKANLVSAYGGKVVWLPMNPHKTEDGSIRMCYKWYHPITKSTKSIEVHNIMALVYNPMASFGRARQDLELFGTYAFGTGEDLFFLNGHHRYRLADYQEKAYIPTNVQFLRGYVHSALRSARAKLTKIHADDTNPDNERKIKEILRSLTNVLDREVPGMYVFVSEGELYNMDGSYQSNKGEYFLNMMTADEVTTFLVNSYGPIRYYQINE